MRLEGVLAVDALDFNWCSEETGGDRGRETVKCQQCSDGGAAGGVPTGWYRAGARMAPSSGMPIRNNGLSVV